MAGRLSAATGKKEHMSQRDREILGEARTWTTMDVVGLAYEGVEDESSNSLTPIIGGRPASAADPDSTYLPRMLTGSLLLVTASGQCYRVHPKPPPPPPSGRENIDKSLILMPPHSPELVSRRCFR